MGMDQHFRERLGCLNSDLEMFWLTDLPSDKRWHFILSAHGLVHIYYMHKNNRTERKHFQKLSVMRKLIFWRSEKLKVIVHANFAAWWYQQYALMHY